jgi:hypothetical protein
MLRDMIFVTVLAALLLVGAASRAHAEEPAREYIYGAELMTSAERQRYRRELAGAKSEDAQKQLRVRQHERMQARARERGVTLDERGIIERRGAR